MRLSVSLRSGGTSRVAGQEQSPGGSGCGPARRVLFGGQNVVVVTERFPVVDPGVEIQGAGRAEGEVRVTREDPGAVLPGLERVGP
jgi:hypothetical protein